ncbi:MAG: hypothetical protein WBN48_18980 [Thiogranum sp.]
MDATEVLNKIVSEIQTCLKSFRSRESEINRIVMKLEGDQIKNHLELCCAESGGLIDTIEKQSDELFGYDDCDQKTLRAFTLEILDLAGRLANTAPRLMLSDQSETESFLQYLCCEPHKKCDRIIECLQKFYSLAEDAENCKRVLRESLDSIEETVVEISDDSCIPLSSQLEEIKEAIASQSCGPAASIVAGSPVATLDIGPQTMQVDRAFASLLGSTLRPVSAGDDPKAVSRYVQRLMEQSFTREKTGPRTFLKLARGVRSGGFAPNAQELQGGRAVLFTHYQKHLPSIEANLRALRPEICECDEDTTNTLKDEIVTNLRALVDEIARPNGALLAKVSLHEQELGRLLRELRHMLGIDAHPAPGIGIELSVGEQEANRQALSLVEDYYDSLVEKIGDLDPANPQRLSRIIEAIAPTVAEIHQALDCAGFQQWDRNAAREFNILDWVREAADSWSIKVRDGDAHAAELQSIHAFADTMLTESKELMAQLPDFVPIGRQRVERAFADLNAHLDGIVKLT